MFYLVSVAEQTGLSIKWSETKTEISHVNFQFSNSLNHFGRFVLDRKLANSANCDVIPQSTGSIFSVSVSYHGFLRLFFAFVEDGLIILFLLENYIK